MIPKAEALKRFAEALDGLQMLHDIKGDGYGTPEDFYANHRQAEAWGRYAWESPAMRIGEKLKRLQAAARGSATVDIVEELRDIAVLAVIGVILEQEALWQETAPIEVDR